MISDSIMSTFTSTYREVFMCADEFYDGKIALKREEVFSCSTKQSVDINLYFLNILAEVIRFKDKILDIGTGNGYVLSEINKKFSGYNLSLIGIDNSPEMLKRSFQAENISYIRAKNENTPFPDKTFDIITAKNVTRFNPKELSRILKDNSFFLMREYSEGKGLVEVANLFPHRLIRSRSISYYTDILSEAGFSIEKVLPLKIKRQFNNVEQLLNTIKSYPFIESFSVDDEKVIVNTFPKHPVITSDPFILLARKERQHE